MSPAAGAVRRLATPALELARRRGRTVAWTPGWMGFGNVLLLALWAFEGRERGTERWVLESPVLTPWLAFFPGLRTVTLSSADVRFLDRRATPWSEASRATGGSEVSRPHEPIDVALVERFVAQVLLPGSRLAPDPTPVPTPTPAPTPAVLVVNVRRGDYYSVPEVRKQYGFDVAAYVRVAVDGSVRASGVPERIEVVSDDVGWCRAELGWLQDVAPVSWSPSGDPQADFATVASSRRLVITNSTFSYWAAHVGNVLHGDNHAEVWAPRFFDRTQNDGRSWLLDERWSVVEGLAGGWEIDGPGSSGAGGAR